MAPVTPLFGASPKTTNREVEHWMNNLNEVQSVINSVEPKLTATGGKWKAVAQHVKEVSDELSQIFNKEDPHFDVIIAGVNSGRKFENAQAEVSKSDMVRERALMRLKKYRDEIEVLRREYKEREKVRERYDHYRVKLDNLEKKGKDQPRIERNQQKLKDAEDAYHAVTAELIQKMETSWKKHVEIFAEASIALWHTQMLMIDEFSKSSEEIRSYVQDYLSNLKTNSGNYTGDRTSSTVEEGADLSKSGGSEEGKFTRPFHDSKHTTENSDSSSPTLEVNGKQGSSSDVYRSMRSTQA
ncbi:hypothetical protein Gasu2_66830 [Galdieria sulphuraria]|uniref:BAR domain-containing protein n=1 Tax=Galdieria sulphuraria TaxID=130081 RepID=M2XTV5_GALSU|nr:uncharacterized protein Gasu_55210 [Galdieria sulphuraria]EME26834.1 hypothetical protein Gasu_55210 [Galdieria sulphuraria]GJD12609.1 hypothetical protein Gasu2_66830 [Galdieria sulphuraria]|eukprot:XP_005703354.1 hypothetical protein Gasu_55210 [Galdieria sulphuraria]